MFVDLFVMYWDVHGRTENLLVDDPEEHHADFMTFWNNIRLRSNQLCNHERGTPGLLAQYIELCGNNRSPQLPHSITVPNRPFRVMDLDNVGVRTQGCLEDDDAMRLVLFFDAVQQEDGHNYAGALASRTLKIWSSYY